MQKTGTLLAHDLIKVYGFGTPRDFEPQIQSLQRSGAIKTTRTQRGNREIVEMDERECSLAVLLVALGRLRIDGRGKDSIADQIARCGDYGPHNILNRLINDAKHGVASDLTIMWGVDSYTGRDNFSCRVGGVPEKFNSEFTLFCSATIRASEMLASFFALQSEG